MIVEFWSFFACERCGLSPEKTTSLLHSVQHDLMWNERLMMPRRDARICAMCVWCLVCSREHVRWSRCVTSCRLSEKFLTCFGPPSTQRWENNGDVFISLSSRSLMKFIKLHNSTTSFSKLGSFFVFIMRRRGWVIATTWKSTSLTATAPLKVKWQLDWAGEVS